MLKKAKKKLDLFREANDICDNYDRILKKAFGKDGGDAADRAAGAEVIRALGSCWLLCDCLEKKQLWPVLVPVAGSHLMRHQRAGFPQHADGCVFARKPSKKGISPRSFKKRKKEDPFNILLSFRDTKSSRPNSNNSVSFTRSRPMLGRVLAEIVSEAGLQIITSKEIDPARHPLEKIFSAAAKFKLDINVNLQDFLCIDHLQLNEFKEKIRNSTKIWSSKVRPHGLFIFVADRIEDRTIHAGSQSFEMYDRVSIWAGMDRGRQPKKIVDTSIKYLVVAVVGQVQEHGEFEFLKAYAQHCVGKENLMLVDSHFERQTFLEIENLRGWLKNRTNNLNEIDLSIEKPLFDITPDDFHKKADRDGKEHHPICIPDFIIHAANVPLGGAAKVVVETMGFKGEDYRKRKKNTHAVMKKILNVRSLLFHDFWYPVKMNQKSRDRKFWRDTRWRITGRQYDQ